MNVVASTRDRIFSALLPLYSFAWRLVLALSVARTLLVIWQWQRVNDVDMLAAVFLQGLRFDLVILGIALAIPALCFPLLASNRHLIVFWKFLVKYYLPTTLLLIVFMEVSTPSFILQFDSRPNILFVEYLDQPKEIAATLWVTYKLPLTFAVIFVGALGIHFARKFRSFAERVSPTGILPAILLTPVLLLLCIGLVRSTMDHRPVNPSTVALSTDPLVNELALSSAYTALYAIYETRHEAEGGFRYAELSDDEVIASVRASMWVPANDFTSSSIPTLHMQAMSVEMTEPKNLVIIIEESLGAEFVGALGGLDLTPNLDALANEGIWFSNLYATGTRSVRGLEAIVSGFTPTPARSVVKLPKSQRNFFTLASFLRPAGYESTFIYGGESQFDNMRRFFMNNGFDRVIDENDYDDPIFTGSWGVSDEDLFARAHEEFSRKHDGPFFSVVFTSSNHSPYQFPDGRIELHDEEKNTVNNAVKYADYALGKFIRAAQKSDYWENTVFLIVADHNSRVYGRDLVPVERFHIPGLILGGSISPAVFEPVASQIDLAPTLLSLICVPAEHPMIGHDLMRPVAQLAAGRAIMQFNTTQAYMVGNRVAILQKDMPVQQFIYQDGRLIAAQDDDPELRTQALAHSVWSSMAYEKSLYRMPPGGEAH